MYTRPSDVTYARAPAYTHSLHVATRIRPITADPLQCFRLPSCISVGPIPWGHSGPLCQLLSLLSSSSSWTSMRRRRATVATPGEWQYKTANGPNIFSNACCSIIDNEHKLWNWALRATQLNEVTKSGSTLRDNKKKTSILAWI